MTNLFRHILFATVYSSIISGVTTTLVRGPLNIAVVQDSEVKFECSSDVSGSVIIWYNSLCLNTGHTPACSKDLIYSSYTGTVRHDPTRFSVTAVNNATHLTRDLNINPTQLSDASFYLCAEFTGADVTDTSSAQLVVLDGNTQCSTNLSASGAIQENDVITMKCSIRYRGNWAPVMRWFNSVTRHNFTDDVITMTTNDTTVTSQLTVTATAGLHGSQIVCVTYFNEPSTSLPTTTTNIPSYKYTWTSPTLDVLSPPTNLQISLRNSTYQPGDRIECTSEGNPEPSYQWTDLVSGTVIQGAVLDISEDMVGKSYVFQCSASNHFNGVMHKDSTTIIFSVADAGSEEPRVDCGPYKSATIALAVIAFMSIVINVILMIYILRKIQTKKKETPGDRQEDRSRPTETGSSSDYSSLNMTSLNAGVVYDSLQPT